MGALATIGVILISPAILRCILDNFLPFFDLTLIDLKTKKVDDDI
ncbi:hypothetical protein [Alkalibaculum sporogenes]|nr:hypothetical protein [Alkalibaculum sporogenes]